MTLKGKVVHLIVYQNISYGTDKYILIKTL